MDQEGRLVAGRYRLLDRIGSGAMGVVWKAQDERLGRVVAVKQLLLSPGLEESAAEEARERAFREGRIAARLQHPHAISVYDVVEHDEQPCLVMEYMASRNLSATMAAEGPMDIREVARIGTQVASALHAAHVAGVVHRDVKPGNVLLGEDGIVKIVDFGISRAAGDVTVTKTGMLAGTPAYLAPEVAKGRPSLPASDVFSLGSTLYAAIEGLPPFGTSDNGLAILHAVAAGDFKPPERAGELTPVLMHMLAADPEQRITMPETQRVLAEVAGGGTATGLTPLHDSGDGGHTVLAPTGPTTPPGAQATTIAAGSAAGAQAGATRLDARPARTHAGQSPPGHTHPGYAEPGEVRPGAARPSRRTPPPPPEPFWRKPAVLAGGGVLAVAAVVLVISTLLSGNDADDARVPSGSDPDQTTEQHTPTNTTESSTPIDEGADPGGADPGYQPAPPPQNGRPDGSDATTVPEPPPSEPTEPPETTTPAAPTPSPTEAPAPTDDTPPGGGDDGGGDDGQDPPPDEETSG
ncbi:serine/threonine-protein kinase [Actinoalloteichus fjordicus]|uniref:non-specific serine/threonine protein kinase n=1 Tax=Actinoalloteichus fjordicus TaxID=1612552 RepID=A0AAC9LGV3_9PSEU|nr:serine/threonine-protein kinase [Actinoalloteichus fjordicus]APU16079.1 protein kinase family protein [Actinoalloteichus fjordicus]